jgi:hypothetical protein
VSRTHADRLRGRRQSVSFSHCVAINQERRKAIPADSGVRKELPFAGYSVVKELFILARPACSASRAVRRTKRGGEYRARTGDLLVANQALSQLS